MIRWSATVLKGSDELLLSEDCSVGGFATETLASARWACFAFSKMPRPQKSLKHLTKNILTHQVQQYVQTRHRSEFLTNTDLRHSAGNA